MDRSVKIILRVQMSCVELVRYIDKHITDINRNGIFINFDKISDDKLTESKVNELSRVGVSRLPALIDSNGKVYTGLKQIIDLFENTSQTRDESYAPIGTADDPDVSKYWHSELFKRDESGKYVARDEQDSNDDDVNDISKKMREYESDVPKHRRTNSGRSRTSNIQPKHTNRGRERDNPEDNIDQDYDEPHSEESNFMPSGGDDSNGDALDDVMMRAWMNNNPSNDATD
jgi:Sec-independent protein translocase protein TatA